MKICDSIEVGPATVLKLKGKANIGHHSYIGCGKLIMEEGSSIGRFCEFMGEGTVYMMEGSQVSSHASIMTSYDTPWGSMSGATDAKFHRVRTSDIIIGKHASLGPHVTVMPGVVIGERACVGAYCFIDSDVEPGMILHPKVRFMEKIRKIDPALFDFFDMTGEEYPYEEEEIQFDDQMGDD